MMEWLGTMVGGKGFDIMALLKSIGLGGTIPKEDVKYFI